MALTKSVFVEAQWERVPLCSQVSEMMHDDIAEYRWLHFVQQALLVYGRQTVGCKALQI
jgi:hypothetical protein